ncbi:hypothetical protein, partial [Klebsiella pneumoniae]|uniref:hypothetical protein n=1 Tax=Klebsiella pneumoniae TaxID=573 RepID=UPI001C547AD7
MPRKPEPVAAPAVIKWTEEEWELIAKVSMQSRKDKFACQGTIALFIEDLQLNLRSHASQTRTGRCSRRHQVDRRRMGIDR